MIEKDNLAEEIFCLKYELNTLADQLLRQSSERWVPGFLFARTENSHTERYKLACEYTNGKKVLDIACGVGKGSNMMGTAGLAKSVRGVDIQSDAIRYATWRYGSDNIIFTENNAQELGIINEFDIAVSFETVEHLPEYRKFLVSIKDSLKVDGLLLISTPLSAFPVDLQPDNPYHIQEWGFSEFQKILEEFFEIKKIYLQLYPSTIEIPKAKISLSQRIINKIKNKALGIPNYSPVQNNTVETNKFSKIEVFNDQFPVAELGVSKLGYQIILAKVKSK